MSESDNRALIAMSGGIDSSVAAFLMIEQGYECAGMTMKLFGDFYGAADAQAVADTLGIPHYTFDFRGAFEREVIDRFADAYIRGHTPNPCVDCNRYIKFKRLFTKAKELGCHYIATGHYANTEYDNVTGRWLLKKAADEKKDQSYFLYTMTKELLDRVKFPLGGLTKPEVREIARRQNFSNADKKESQDICFIRGGDYAGFIEKYTGKSFPPGNFVDISGNILGRHVGVIRYTIGQKRGLGLSLGEAVYVREIDAVNNAVVLCGEQDLYSKALDAYDINFIPFDKIDKKLKVHAKIRYNQPAQQAVAEQTGENAFRVEFESPQRAVTKGQAVVLYDGDIVLGGGTIG